MAIDGTLRGRLAPGTRLTARFKGIEYEAEVVAGEEGQLRFRLEDGREFTSAERYLSLRLQSSSVM